MGGVPYRGISTFICVPIPPFPIQIPYLIVAFISISHEFQSNVFFTQKRRFGVGVLQVLAVLVLEGLPLQGEEAQLGEAQLFRRVGDARLVCMVYVLH